MKEKPEPQQPGSDIWPKLIRGEISMSLAAESLNRSLFDFMLLPALTNLSEKDPRRRHPIPAFSGKRLATRIDTGAAIGIDATALITMSFLGLLDETLDAFNEIHIPHLTLARLFEKKRRTRFRPVVPPETATETEASEYCRNISDKVDRLIERIRASLNSRIESGKVKVAGQNNEKEPSDHRLITHTTDDMFALPSDCDLIVVDDRWINQQVAITNIDGKELPVFSTLDVLNTLDSPQEELYKCRTLLRRAGYFFVPVVPLELKDHLDAATVRNGRMEETPGLRAIRENILCAQMNNWRQLPEEWFWLEESLTAFTRTLDKLWTENPDFGEARTRSDWIADQIDFRALAYVLGRKNENHVDEKEFGRRVMETLLSGGRKSKKASEEYRKWLEDSVLRPLKEQSPDSYRWIVELCREEIARWTEDMCLNLERSLPTTRAEAVIRVLKNSVPTLMRETLLNEPAFRKEYELEHGPVLSFEISAVSFRGADLFPAVRNVLSGTPMEEVTDTEDRKWKLKNASKEGRLPSLALFRDGTRFSVSSDFVALSPDKETRLRLLEESSSEFDLPNRDRNAWRKILEKRSLEYGEREEFGNDFIDTPTHFARSMRDKFSGPESEVSSLVPSSRRYFERLVGKYDGSDAVRDYSAGGGRIFLRGLSKRRPYEGFLASLLLSSHPAMTAEIPVDGLDEDGFARACDFLEKHGDKVSQLGAVEVGFRVLLSMPGIEPRLVRLIKRVRDDNADAEANGFRFFSALFVLVDGELARTRIFSSEPPFYRKLAALSQAALIHRQLAEHSIDVDRFYNYAAAARGLIHFLQSLVDMRLEPHWNSLLGTPEQFRLIFLGRIVTAAKEHERNIRTEELRELVLGDKPESVLSVTHPFLSYFPGSLDGAKGPSRDLPDDRMEAIRIQTAAEAVTPSSFIVLVNSARLYRLDSGHAELAAKALRFCRHQISGIENQTHLSVMLNGLATVAAVARSHALADELRTLVRRYRHDVQHPVPVEEEAVLCLAVAASRADPDGWTEFVGDWMTELAFEAKENEAKPLLSQLLCLCHIVPDLWISCGRACAALKALSR